MSHNRRSVWTWGLAAALMLAAAGLLAVVGCQGSTAERAEGTAGQWVDHRYPNTMPPAQSAYAAEDRYELSTRQNGFAQTEQLWSANAWASGLVRDAGGQRAVTSVLPGEELWVIVKPDSSRVRPPPDDDYPGTGALLTELDGERVPVPLEHTDVEARVDGFIASVDVAQRFHNPFDGTIEAVYVFPLPDDAAVNGFVMRIGERTIRGVIRKKEQAEQIYNEARARGHTAALLTQQRPNIFTQKVANIDPGKRIDIDITYFHTLTYADGWFEYVFPMVVGPRYNPVGTDGIGATGRGGSRLSPHATNVEYLTPRERSGHDIAIDLTINAGVEVEEIRSATHRLEVASPSRSVRRVRLAAGTTIPNKDFVVRYRVAGDEVKSGLVLQPSANGRGGHFAMMVIPPAQTRYLERAPVEFVFVLDCSGSMSGRPLALAKEAVEAGLDRLQAGDTFQIIRFSEKASSLGRQPLAATPGNIREARRYLRSLNSGGGTEMVQGIRAALDYRSDRDRTRYVTFLTDGFIGNEDQVMRVLHGSLGDSRVFSFGIGKSTNRFLMNEMARVGRGASAYIGVADGADEVMNLFFDRVSKPALTDVSIDWGGLRARDVYPKRLPDLYVGRALLVTGEYEGTVQGSRPVRLSGRVAGETRSMTLETGDVSQAERGALAAVWARTKIAHLATEARTGGRSSGSAERRIERVALDHGLVSAFTSFVAVDSMTKTRSTHGTTVPVPVPVPEGVRYDTSVSGDG